MGADFFDVVGVDGGVGGCWKWWAVVVVLEELREFHLDLLCGCELGGSVESFEGLSVLVVTEVLHYGADVLFVALLLSLSLVLLAFVVSGSFALVVEVEELFELCVVDLLYPVADGLGVCGMPLASAARTLPVRVAEDHPRDGKE